MLQLMQNGTVIMTTLNGAQFTLPNGDVVSPAYEGWSNGDFELVAVPPPPVPTPEEQLQAERSMMRLSFAQLVIGLVTEGWISEADGDSWLQGVLPAAVLTTINLLPSAQQFSARAKATRPSYVDRLNPLVEMMAMAQSRGPEEVDTFFRTYATI